MSFSFPLALLLLLVLPVVWYIGRPRYVFRRRRDVTSLILRTLLFTLIILALAGLQVVTAVDKLAVVFLVDASDSMGPDARTAQLDYIRQAVANKPPEDEWGIVVFGETVSIDKPFSPVAEVPPIRSTILPTNTNIAEALQAGMSLFPVDVVRRIVILSDGRETLGNALAKAQLAEASGVEINYVTFLRDPAPDARVITLDAPARVAEGQEFDITVAIESDVEAPASLLIFSGGRLIQESDIELRPGTTGFTLTQTATESGFLNFAARVVVQGDDIVQNDELAAFSQVIGAPRVLLVANDSDEIGQLRAALISVGMNIDVLAPGALPPTTAALANYKSIIIANIPAIDFSQAQMLLLQSYVRDLGGGLVFIGGPDTYGPAYADTPIEALLPVEMQIKDQQRLPQLTIAYLIDRSGSMGATTNDIANIELAKRAIDLSIGMLQPTDRVAIGTFDASGSWVAQFQNVNDKAELQRLIGTLRSGGGTDILAGMRLVERDIVNEPAPLKHIILVTDGGSSPLGLIELTERLHDEYNVTTTTIAISPRPPSFLRGMAEAGGGNYHQVTDLSEIPRILSQETVLATRAYIQEGSYIPVVTANSPIIEGIRSTPPLLGYVATSLKATGQAVLRTEPPYRDPLLAQWQYGLGRAVAFTSDATTRWGAGWTTWNDFARFWSQAISWTITEQDENNIETRILMREERAVIMVDARAADGAFLNNLALEANILNPLNERRTIRLQQIAPGQYEATFLPEGEGAYFVAINGTDAAGNLLREVTGWVMSYSAEYLPGEADETLLAMMATHTGGAEVSNLPNAVFAHNAEFRTASAPIAPLLLILALLLLPLDIAVRRLIITRSDLQRLRAYLFPEQLASAVQVERMSALQAARERARERTTEAAPTDTTGALKARKTEPPNPRTVDGEGETPPDTSLPSPKRPEMPRPTIGEDSTVGALLKRRKRDDSEANP